MIVAAVGMLLANASGSDTPEVYPGPGRNTYRSDLYRVEVGDQSQWLDSYTYKVARSSITGWQSNSWPSVNFTTFGTTHDIPVRVSLIGGSVTSLKISPRSKNILPTIRDGHATFTLKPYDKAWIIVNGDESDPLFIFADPPKPRCPAGALYLGPGIHDIGRQFKTRNGEVIYLDGGAWVRGTFDLRGRSNVRITGPGVLSGEKWRAEDVDRRRDRTPFQMIVGDRNPASRDNRIEDITIVDSPSYNITGGPEYIGNVKLLSPWYWSTDGFQVIPRGSGRLALIEHCFAFVGDDVFFPRENFRGNIEIRDCFVGSDNNSIFQICYWGDKLAHHFTMHAHDIDIMNHIEGGAVFRASIDGLPGAGTGVKNMTFENIHIEGDSSAPLLQIENRPYFFGGKTNAACGNTYNMVFRNISVNGPTPQKSTLLGLDAKNGHHDYLFENLIINGEVVTESNYESFFTLNGFTSNIRFEATP